MNQEAAFVKTLEEVRAIAIKQRNMLTEEQVEEIFGSIGIEGEQLEPVYAYLRRKKIGIGKPIDQEACLTARDRNYLEDYICTLDALPVLSEGEKRAFSMSAMAGQQEGKEKILHAFLPQVVDIARLYAGQGVLMEDLIGEGNVALAAGIDMLGCLEDPDEADGMLGKRIMDAMEAAVHRNDLANQADRKMEELVNRVSGLAKELADNLRRKVTVEELAAETAIDEEEIRKAVRLSGDRIEDIRL